MKLCIISPHFYPHVGGAEQALMDIAQELLKKGVEIRVVTSSSGEKIKNTVYKGIEIYYYDWPLLFGHPLAFQKDLVEHIKWADIVHSAVYSVVPPTAKACKKLHKPHVCTVHEVLGKKWFWIEPNKIKALLFKLYEKYTVMQHAELFIVPSTATLKDLENCNKKCKVKKIFWISEFDSSTKKVNQKQYYDYFGITKEDKVFLNYGRPGKTKGVFIYLEAIKLLAKEISKEKMKHIKFCFIMASDPAKEREKFIDTVNKNNLNQYVIVKESVSREDLNNYRSLADYIVVPSITEGFGLSAIEACEFHKKLICSTAGSLPEVTYGEVIHFENRNSLDLANKLKGVILNTIEFEKKEKKDFSKETITNEFIKTYKEVIKNYKK